MSDLVGNSTEGGAALGLAALVALGIGAVLATSACREEGEPAGSTASATGTIAFASCSELFFGCLADLYTMNADGSGSVRLADDAVSYRFTEGAGGFA